MIRLIQATCLSPTELVEAQAILDSHLKQRPIDFINRAFQIFCDDHINIIVRQQASALLRDAIMVNGIQSAWNHLPKQDRDDIKAKTLGLLTNPEMMLKAGKILATICVVELPLTHFTQCLADRGCLGSILSLGLLCALHGKNNITLHPAQVEIILTGITTGMHSPIPEVPNASLQCFVDYLSLFEPLMANPATLQLALTELASHIQQQSTSELALSALAQLTSWLQKPFMQVFAVLTLPFLQQPHRVKHCTLAMQIWKSIAENASRDPTSAEYLKGLGKEATDGLLANMCIEVLRDKAFEALKAIGLVEGNTIFPQVLDFTNTHIHSEDHKARSASLRALCSLFGGVQKSNMEQAINCALTELLKMLEDSNRDVLHSAFFCLSRISQEFPQCFVCREDLEKIIEQLKLKLGISLQISIYIADIYFSLTEGLPPPTYLEMLQPRLEAVILDLINQANSCLEDESIVKQSHFTVIGTLGLVNVQLLLKMIPFLLGQLAKVQNNTRLIQILDLIGMCLFSIRRMGIDKLQTQTQDEIVEIITHLFDKRGVTKQGLKVLTQVLCFLPCETDYFGQVWPYIQVNLNADLEKALFNSGLGCLSQLAVAKSQGLQKTSNIVLEMLLKKAQQMQVLNKIDYSSDVISCLGDVILFMEAAAVPYLSRIMDTLVAYYTMCQPSQEKFNQMMTAALEMTLSVVYCLPNIKGHFAHQIISKYTGRIVDFVKSNQAYLNVDFAKDALMIFTDLMNRTKKIGTNALNLVKKLIQTVKALDTEGKYAQQIQYSEKSLSKVY